MMDRLERVRAALSAGVAILATGPGAACSSPPDPLRPRKHP